MPTNLQIDDELLDEARRIGGFRTKRETVNHALESFVKRMKRRQFRELRGRIDFDEAFDYKTARRKR